MLLPAHFSPAASSIELEQARIIHLGSLGVAETNSTATWQSFYGNLALSPID
jgi:hypothetical protein